MFRGIDVSYYEPSIDWLVASNNNVGFSFMKATQGTALDSSFKKFWADSKGVIPRGAYHFYDGRYATPASQVNEFVSSMGGDYGELPFVLDIEGTYANGTGYPYTGYSRWIEFLELLKNTVPGKEIIIYTNVGSWNDYVPASNVSYFSQYPLWVANYGALSPAIPNGWDTWLFWQYSEDGVVTGINNAKVDLNWYNGDKASFYARFNLPYDDSDTIEMMFEDKVAITHGYREVPRPFYFHVAKFKKSDVERESVSDAKYLRTTKYYLESRGCHIAVNGDEGSPNINNPKAIGLSDGFFYKSTTSETSIQWDINHNILGMLWFKHKDAYNAVGGSNILLQGGIVPDTLDQNEPDPRTTIFWNDEYYFLIMIDGRNNGTLGLTKRETALFALYLGATDGHNLDGGDSCSLLVNDNGTGVIKNNPPDGKLHQLINHVGFWIKMDGTTPPPPPPTTGEGMKTFKVIKALGLRPITSMNSTSIRQVASGTTWSTDVAIEVVNEYNQSVPFVYYSDGQGDGWMPMVWNGVTYIEEVVGTPPPTPVGPAYNFKIDGYKAVIGNLEEE